MKLTLSEPRYLKDSITIISDLVNEATFKVTKEGIELIAMDPANVAMVIYKLFSSAFIEYEVPEDTSIGINLNNLKAILRRTKPSDTLTLEVKENKLNIVLKGSSTRTFSIPIIELEDREQSVPDLKFNAKMIANATTLNEAIEDVDVVAEAVSFSAENDVITIKAEGDLSRAIIEIKSDENTKIEASAPVKSKYSIEYLKKMISGSKLATNVELSFNQDYPIKLDYKVIDRVLLSFILAPRVEND